MSTNDILQLKEQFNVYVVSIKENRNELAHYPLKMSMSLKILRKDGFQTGVHCMGLVTPISNYLKIYERIRLIHA